MTLVEQAVIAAARQAAPLQSDLAAAGRTWRILYQLVAHLDGALPREQLDDATRAFLDQVALGNIPRRTVETRAPLAGRGFRVDEPVVPVVRPPATGAPQGRLF